MSRSSFDMESGANAPPEGRNPNWEIALCEIGDCSKCCYSCFLPCCAIAEARTIMDGSNWLVNCVCMSPVPMRWMARTAYNIPGNAQDDCWTALCCPCCATNQILQTAYARGRPDIPAVGPDFNIHERTYFNTRSTQDKVYDGLYALCCRPCAIGYAMQSVGMPCWFGGCCVSPYAATSILRYHQRIKPDFNSSEVVTDFAIPSVLLMCGQNTGQVSSTFANWAYTWVNLAEQNERVGRNGWYGLNCLEMCAYVSNYCCNGCACQQTDTGRYLLNDESPMGNVGHARALAVPSAPGYAPLHTHSDHEAQQLHYVVPVVVQHAPQQIYSQPM